MKKVFGLIILLFVLHPAFAQDETDSVAYEDYSEVVEGELNKGEENHRVGINDSTLVSERHFANDEVNALKDELHYEFEEPPTLAETLLDRIIRWIIEFIASFFEATATTSWGKLFTYALTLIVVIIVIFLMLKLDAYKVFFRGQGAQVNQTVLEENIHEINFDLEIQKALQNQDYRRGVRLIFLFALKKLSDQHLINWQQGKTNHEYVNELKSGTVKEKLDQLSYYFDYAWYGNFAVNRELFDKVSNVFNSLKENVK